MARCDECNSKSGHEEWCNLNTEPLPAPRPREDRWIATCTTVARPWLNEPAGTCERTFTARAGLTDAEAMIVAARALAHDKLNGAIAAIVSVAKETP